jgi:hypothetical protein
MPKYLRQSLSARGRALLIVFWLRTIHIIVTVSSLMSRNNRSFRILCMEEVFGTNVEIQTRVRGPIVFVSEKVVDVCIRSTYFIQ